MTHGFTPEAPSAAFLTRRHPHGLPAAEHAAAFSSSSRHRRPCAAPRCRDPGTARARRPPHALLARPVADVPPCAWVRLPTAGTKVSLFSAAPQQAPPSRPRRTARPGPDGGAKRRAPSGLFFANLAEAVTEGRGTAQAESLRRASANRETAAFVPLPASRKAGLPTPPSCRPWPARHRRAAPSSYWRRNGTDYGRPPRAT